MAPDPFHAIYTPDMIQRANRNHSELKNRHPVIDEFGKHEESRNFAVAIQGEGISFLYGAHNRVGPSYWAPNEVS